MADESIKAPEVKYPDIKEFAKNNYYQWKKK